MTTPYSLSNPPHAPKAPPKRLHASPSTPRIGFAMQLSRLVLPSTPPPPAPKKKKARVERNLSPIIIDWGIGGAAEDEKKVAQQLADSLCVRAKYLTHTPADIERESSIPFLERLWELYFPASQPRNAYEEAYLSLMRDCIDSRLGLLRTL